VKRVLQPELLDTLPPDDPRAIHSRRDLHRVNKWMGNHSRLARALSEALNGNGLNRVTDLGAGDGNFLLQIAQSISPRRLNVKARLLDQQPNVGGETIRAFAASGWSVEIVVADVFDWLPASGDHEIVMANLFLHHFADERLKQLLGLISERAKFFVAVEPRRAPLALFFSRLLWVIGCNSVTRHDAAVSVRAGFSGDELSTLWPAGPDWKLAELRAGAFSHLFVARKFR
jgi:hypothetical protein